MQTGKCLDLSFSATQSKASAGVAQIGQSLEAQGLTDPWAGDVRIALTEAINNVVEHAYAGTSPAEVEVRCQLYKSRLDILITDTGNPLPGLRIPAGVLAPLGSTLDELPEGGFGWFLIHELTSEIHYERSNGRNRLSLRFDFTEPA